MTGFLPIVGRELLVAARRSATYWARFQAALVALIPTGLILFSQSLSATAPAVMGAQIFRTLSFLALIYAMLTAIRLTSDCLSSEKREGTLGFLFLTDLKPYDVVFGKLAATSWSGLYGLLAILPVLAIPVMCGGVTLGDVFRLAVVLMNSLFFSVALALLVSAWSWQARTAAGMTFLLLLSVCVVLPVVGAMTGALFGVSLGMLMLAVGLFSPITSCWLVVDSGAAAWGMGMGFPSRQWLFWTSILFTHLLGWVLLVLCCGSLPRVWMDRPPEKRRLRWREWCRRMLLGDVATRNAYRARALELNPIYWLGSRELRVRWYPWIFLGSMSGILVFSCWALRVHRVEYAALIGIGFAFHLFFKQWVTHFACHAFGSERDKGALELLLSTPLSVREMVRGHALVLRRLFGPPILFLLGMEFVGWGSALVDTREWSGSNRMVGSLWFLCGVLVFVADLWALAWVGWWMGASTRHPSRASSSTVMRLLLLPLAMLGVILTALRLSVEMDDSSFTALGVVLYLVISLVVDGLFARRARHSLLTGLRAAAVERYSHR